MNYYYALLESYELLKKRKFKLSINEQEDEQEMAELEQAATDFQAAGQAAFQGEDQIDVGNKGNISITKQEDQKGGSPVIKIEGSNLGSKNYSESEFKNTWQKGLSTPNSKARKLASAWRGGAEAKGGGETQDVQDQATSKPLGAESLKIQAEMEAEKAALVEELRQSFDEMGIEYDESHLDAKVDNTLALTKISLEQIKETFAGAAELLRIGKKIKSRRGDYSTVTGLLELAPKVKELKDTYGITISKEGEVLIKGISLGSDPESLDNTELKKVVELLQEIKKLSEETLGIADEMVSIDIVDLDEVGDKTENLRGVAMENLEILTSQQAECIELEDGEEKSKCLSRFHTSIVEAIKLRQEFEKEKEECKKKAQESFEEKQEKLRCMDKVNRMGKGKKVIGISFKELIDVFRIGIVAADDNVLMDEEGNLNMETVKWVKDRLMITTGMNEDQADEYMKQITGMDENDQIVHDGDGLKILFLLSLANRKYAEQINGDLKPSVIIPMGQGQGDHYSNIVGAKVDLESGYCPDQGSYKGKDSKTVKDELTNHVRDNLLSEEQIDHYTKDCDGNSETDPDKRKDAIDKIIQEDLIGDLEEVTDKDGNVICKEGYRIARDPKTHKNGKSHSTFGEMSNKIQDAMFEYFCTESSEGFEKIDKDDKKTKKQIARMKQIKNTMEDCNGSGSVDGACNFHTLATSATSSIDSVLTKDNYVEGEGDAQQTMLNQWKRDQTGLSKDDAEIRANAALRCLKGEADGKPSIQGKKPKKDCDHLTSLKESLRNTTISKLLDEHTNSDGTLSGVADNYYRLLYVSVAGSDREIIQDKRGLGDNTQATMLRNAEIKANLRSAKFVRTCSKVSDKPPCKDSGYSQRVDIVDNVKDKTDRANIQFDRGTMKVRSGDNPSIHRILGDEDTEEERRDPKQWKKKKKKKKSNENLFLTFLTGQQKLLEKLIDQTT